MPNLTFSFETGAVPLSRIVNAICTEYNYQAMIPNLPTDTTLIPNPETKAQFARRIVKEFIIAIVKNQEQTAARTTAEATVTPIVLT